MEPAFPISAWQAVDSLRSPNGDLVVTFGDWGEIAMGGPLAGSLVLPGGRRVEGCGSSVVWSDDSRCIAMPLWTEHRMQRLLVIDVQGKRFCYAEETYSVLELHSFRDGIVRGVDSPIHHPRDVCVDTKTLHWREGFAYAAPVPSELRDNTAGCLGTAGLVAGTLLAAIVQTLW